MADLMKIPLGYDQFTAQVITQACRADGLQVELLMMNENGNAPGMVALEPPELLIRTEDRDAVQAIIDRQSAD